MKHSSRTKPENIPSDCHNSPRTFSRRTKNHSKPVIFPKYHLCDLYKHTIIFDLINAQDPRSIPHSPSSKTFRQTAITAPALFSRQTKTRSKPVIFPKYHLCDLYKHTIFDLTKIHFINCCTKTYNFCPFQTDIREVCTLFTVFIVTAERLSAETLLYSPQQLDNAPDMSVNEHPYPTASAPVTGMTP